MDTQNCKKFRTSTATLKGRKKDNISNNELSSENQQRPTQSDRTKGLVMEKCRLHDFLCQERESERERERVRELERQRQKETERDPEEQREQNRKQKERSTASKKSFTKCHFHST